MESRFSDPTSGPLHHPDPPHHSGPPGHLAARALAAALAFVPGAAAHAHSTLPTRPITRPRTNAPGRVGIGSKLRGPCRPGKQVGYSTTRARAAECAAGRGGFGEQLG